MLRIGVLGAARIAPKAIVQPARETTGVEVRAIAARDPRRAVSFAQKHGIPVVHETYGRLVDDPTLDAVYIPLANSLHHEWTLHALRSGKHVLCEKPLASNALEACEMAATALEQGRILMEAFHYRYHPLAARIREIIDEGQIGLVRRIDAYACTIIRNLQDVRFRYELAGGALMDMGCYAVNMARFIANAEPTVHTAQAQRLSPEIDRRLDAELRFPNGVHARITCSLFSRAMLRIQLIVHGEQGTLNVLNPMLPHYGHLLIVRTKHGRRWEQIAGSSTYTHQLRAFRDAVLSGVAPLTDGWDGAANMRVIDDIYRTANMRLRSG